MRKFIDIVSDKTNTKSSLLLEMERRIITEAADYAQLFKPVLDEYDEIEQEATEKMGAEEASKITNELRVTARSEIESVIQWAKKTLKAEDRVMWFLRFVRLSMLSRSKRQKELRNMMSRFGMSEEELVKYSNYFRQKDGQNIIKHYFSIPYPKIHGLRLSWDKPDDVFKHLSDLEMEWRESLKEDEQIFPVDPENEEILIRDGEWYWVGLNRGGCSLEARAMGHCGNGSGRTGQRLLSLRRLIVRGDEKYWRPSLTFILEQDGYLGEMKGRGNDKPAKKYHPMIIRLLERTDIIKGIRGGGYLPENNFSMADLTEEQRQALYEKNPELMTLVDYFKTHGSTDVLRQKVAKYLNKPVESVVMDDTLAVIETFYDFEDFVRKWCDKEAQDYLDFEPEFSSSDVSRYNVIDLVENFPEDLIAQLAEKVEGEMSEDDVEDRDLSDISDLVVMLEEYLPDIYDHLCVSYAMGLESGSRDEASRAYDALMNDKIEIALGDDTTMATIEGDRYEGYIVAKVPILDYLQWLEGDDHNMGVLEKPNISVPYYGFNDYDESSAIEYAKETLPDLI